MHNCLPARPHARKPRVVMLIKDPPTRGSGNKTVRSHFLNHKNPFVRKGCGVALALPRTALRFSAKVSDYAERPPIFCNSMPKSGTHLLKQVALGLSKNLDFGAFIASMPSITQVERPKSAMLRRLRSMIPGEVVLGHLFYEDAFKAEFEKTNAVHCFLYRDPRDVVISEAHYLRTQNKWHHLHPLFAAARNIDEAVMLSIRGGRDAKSGAVMQDINQRYSRYLGWLSCPNVFCIRYEDLVSNANVKIKVREMALFYEACSRSPAGDTIEERTARALEAINPGRSHTFRKGMAGGWRNELKPEHVAAIKEVAGLLLIKLDYESDLGW